LVLLTKNGRRVPIHVTVAPLLDHSGSTVGRVAIVRDVSNERELDQLRTSLISTLSRELRSPLTMIHGFSELLLTRDLKGKDSREALDQINASAGRLARTVGDLVSVLRIESGRVVMNRSRVDLARVLDEVIVPYGGAPKIKVDVNGGVPPVLADRDMLGQVLANLVSNAVKFSPPGAQVSVGAKPNGASVNVYVEDHGIGVSEQERVQLFRKFGRVDRPEVQEAGGTGLGLYIAKNLVEMQGGRIWVRSEPGRGSTFGFSVPLAETRESAPTPS
jgi:two-component system phosphate regulon sensor histidine kinase PhoR